MVVANEGLWIPEDAMICHVRIVQSVVQWRGIAFEQELGDQVTRHNKR